MHIDESFADLLSDFELKSLQNEPAVIYGVWSDLRLAYTNPAWFRFAADNGGEAEFARNWPLGRSILDAIADPLRTFFVENFRRAVESLRPWEHAYDCPSDVLQQKFRMTAFPLGSGEGLLVVNTLVATAPVEKDAEPGIEALYRDADGLIHQCAHCRCVRREPEELGWAWVPEWTRRPPLMTSHGICPTCFGFYYSNRQMDRDTVVQPFATDDP